MVVFVILYPNSTTILSPASALTFPVKLILPSVAPAAVSGTSVAPLVLSAQT